MGKGNWFSSVKKALSPNSKEKKDQKSKKKWFGKQKYPASNSASSEVIAVQQPLQAPIPPPEVVKLTNVENEQNNHSYSVAAAEAKVMAPPEAVQRTRITQFAGKSKEEIGAIKIQTAFRGYMSRRALRALRGLVRLKSLMDGPVVKRQATNTLRCMQTLAHIQSQIRYRRIRMSEENQALQRQLLQKHAIELDKLRIGEEWDDSAQSKEQVEAGLLSRHEAAMRRERALAYAFSHQQNKKNASKSMNPMFVDPVNPTWGWSWLERWMAARSTTEKDLHDSSSIKSSTQSIAGGDISTAYARFQLNPDKQSPKPNPKPRVARKPKPASPMGLNDDCRSTTSMQSDRFRRHSVAGSSVGDDESLASSTSVPSYMTPTKSARAKSRLERPAEMEINEPTGLVKKRLSFPESPAARPPRRHSGPPKIDTSIVVANGVTIGGSG